jgi:hypothetical protein
MTFKGGAHHETSPRATSLQRYRDLRDLLAALVPCGWRARKDYAHWQDWRESGGRRGPAAETLLAVARVTRT